MRLLIRIFVILAVIWSLWWAVASFVLSRGIDAWITARTDEGWSVGIQSGQVGFPLNISTKLAVVDVDNPITGFGVSARDTTVKARTYWPGHVDIVLPDSPVQFRNQAAQTTLTTKDASLALRLRPGFALEIGQLAFESDRWQIQAGALDMLSGTGFVLRGDQPARGSGHYDIRLNAQDLAISDAARQLLALPQSLPPTFETFALTGGVSFAQPLALTTTEDTPAQITQIVVEAARIEWGSIALQAMGAIDVDKEGIPSGRIDVQAKDWANLLDLAQANGALPDAQRGQAELMFRLFANRGGSPDDLDLTLAFEEGQMILSGIRLGPAPRILLQ